MKRRLVNDILIYIGKGSITQFNTGKPRFYIIVKKQENYVKCNFNIDKYCFILKYRKLQSN